MAKRRKKGESLASFNSKSGRTISVSTRDELDPCCDDSALVYPQADWCYSVGSSLSDSPRNFLFVLGTIYIDGVPSSNPLRCTLNHCYRGD